MMLRAIVIFLIIMACLGVFGGLRLALRQALRPCPRCGARGKSCRCGGGGAA